MFRKDVYSISECSSSIKLFCWHYFSWNITSKRSLMYNRNIKLQTIWRWNMMKYKMCSISTTNYDEESDDLSFRKSFCKRTEHNTILILVNKFFFVFFEDFKNISRFSLIRNSWRHFFMQIIKQILVFVLNDFRFMTNCE